MSKPLPAIPPEDRPTVTPAAIAEAVGIGETTALELLRSGTIKANKIGRFWRTTPRNLQAYIDATAEAALRESVPSG